MRLETEPPQLAAREYSRAPSESRTHRLDPDHLADLGLARRIDADQLAEPDETRQAGDAEMRRRDLGDRAADACQRRALLKLEKRPL